MQLFLSSSAMYKFSSARISPRLSSPYLREEYRGNIFSPFVIIKKNIEMQTIYKQKQQITEESKGQFDQ